MKVAGVKPLSRNRLLGAARIVIIGRMVRLMQVADEVEEKFQGQQPLRGGRGGFGKFGCKLIDFVHHTNHGDPVEAGIPGGRGGWP